MRTKTLCLGALSFKEGTGYDIKKLFEAAFSHFQNASYGSIYPALRQLEADGLVTCRVEPGDKHPDKKLFTLTQAGATRLAEELASTPATERIRSDFLALLFFAHLMPGDLLAAKLDEIERHYRAELAYLESLGEQDGHTAGIRFGIEQGILVYRAKLAHLDEKRAQLLQQHREPPQAPRETGQ